MSVGTARKYQPWTIIELLEHVDLGWGYGKTVFQAVKDRFVDESILEPIYNQENSDSNVLLPPYELRELQNILNHLIPGSTLDDLREEPCIIALPSVERWEVLGYCLKYDSNGTVYLAVKSRYSHLMRTWLNLCECPFEVISRAQI
jgi:hypothetical protein